MAFKEILCAVVFLHRKHDDKDFTETVNCIPQERADELKAQLLEWQNEGIIDTVQVGAYWKEVHPLSEQEDQVDKFLNKIWPRSTTERATPSEGEDDGSTPSEASSFTGFDDVDEPNS